MNLSPKSDATRAALDATGLPTVETVGDVLPDSFTGSKADAVKELGMDANRIDYALPQGFLTDVHSACGIYAAGLFVWSYELGGFTGSPRPLTRQAVRLLERLNLETGSRYPVNYRLRPETLRVRSSVNPSGAPFRLLSLLLLCAIALPLSGCGEETRALRVCGSVWGNSSEVRAACSELDRARSASGNEAVKRYATAREEAARMRRDAARRVIVADSLSAFERLERARLSSY